MKPLVAGDPAMVGPYRLVARLGAGGMGRVYLGYSGGKRAVAVKVVHAEHARDEEFRARFRTEVAAARRVNAAFTAPVIDAGEDDDPPWLATAFVPGPSLEEVVKEFGVLPEEAVWRLIAGLAEALAAVHACDLVHRDLKPANVLIAADGPRLIDFGLSRALDAISLTATGYIVGTPAFMSPEQIDGERIGPESDVFSLGALLVFAATGRPPFGAGQSADLFFRILQSEPDFGGLSGPLPDLAARCLAKDPSARPSPADIMAAVPDHASTSAVLSLVRFWPAPVDSFITAYQERLAGTVPDSPVPDSTVPDSSVPDSSAPSDPGSARTQPPSPAPGRQVPPPFRPPREIAAEAAGLAESGRADAARQMLSSAAKLRPDQEVAALITTLRGDHRHSDAETVISAAARRPAAEVAALSDVLRQIGIPDDADRLLDEAGFRPPAEIGPIAGVLAGEDRTRELRRLLHSAITVHRAPAALVALVTGLSAAGLGSETGRLISLVAAGLADSEAAGLADALRAAGQDDAAFLLYSRALDPVARRPPEEIASLLAAMRRAGRDNAADQLISAVSSVRREPGEVAELAAALWSASLDGDSRRMLDAAVSAMGVDEIVGIAGSLLMMDRPEAALSLLTGAAARHPAAASATFVRALRDAGRPVDARRVLDSAQDWPPAKTAQLIVSLRAAGADADADRVVAGSRARSVEQMGDLMAELTLLGADSDCFKVAGLTRFEDPVAVCALVARMVAGGRPAAADDFLVRAAAVSPDFCCDLIGELMRQGQRDGAAFLLAQQAVKDNGSILRILVGLRERGNDEAAGRLLMHVANRPVDQLAGLADELSRTEASEVIALIAAMSLVRPQDVGQVLTAALPARGARAAEFLAALAADPRIGMTTVAAALEARLPDQLASFFLLIIRRHHGAGNELGQVVAGLRSAGLMRAVGILLDTAAAQLDSVDFCALYMNLRTRPFDDEADYLFARAAYSPNVPLLVSTLRDYGYVKEARLLRKAEPRR